MIISIGLHTDIPAFYSKWLIKRIEEGYVYVRHPLFQNMVFKYLLNPNLVDCLCFYSKNPQPMLDKLDKISMFKQIWYISITPYGNKIELNTPPLNEVIKSFQELAIKIGSGAVIWRYDPIFYGYGFNRKAHLEGFEKIAKALKGYTHVCIIKFLKTSKRCSKELPTSFTPGFGEQKELIKEMVKIAAKYDIIIKICPENSNLGELGINNFGCQTKQDLEKIIHDKLIIPNKKRPYQKCNCLIGNDIGAFNCCLNLCKYCSFNKSKEAVLERIKLHNPNSPLLIGNLTDKDKLYEVNQKSFKLGQIKLDI